MSGNLDIPARVERRKRKDVSRFGRFVDALNILFGLNDPLLAEASGLTKEAISRVARASETSKRDPERATVYMLRDTYRRLSEERHVSLPPAWGYAFCVAAWLEENEPSESVDNILASLEERARLVQALQKRERENALLREQIRELRSEVKGLKKAQKSQHS